MNEGRRERSLQSLLKRCDVVVCNSSSLLSIVNTDGLDFSPIFTNISSPAESVPDSVSHLNYLLGFLVSFILTVVFLTLVSHTKPNQDSRFCVLDSTWVVATASLLNIQHARLHSASIRVLVLGWSLFSTSYFFCYLRHSLTETRQSGQSSLYILGNRDCDQVNRIVGTLNAANISGEYTEQKDHLSDLPIVPYIGLGVVMLVCLLASCLEMLVKTCERRGGRDGGSQSSQGGEREQPLDLGLVDSVERAVDETSPQCLAPHCVTDCRVRGDVEQLHPPSLPGCLQHGHQASSVNTGAHWEYHMNLISI